MDRLPRYRTRIVHRPLTALALATVASALSGCVSTAPAQHPVAIDSKHALIDSYLIAHGMAVGYCRSGRAGPAEITQVIQYDRAAMIAVANAAFAPGSGHIRQAQNAVGAMLRYTSTQDLSGITAPDAPPPPTQDP